MPPRSHWKGYLKLSLVSCPIPLYPAISAAERLSFRQINRETGHRVRQQLVDTVTGEVVEPHNKGRGYEVGENQFLIVQNKELEAARQDARTRPFSAAPAPPLQPGIQKMSRASEKRLLSSLTLRNGRRSQQP
jgi:DNA end-binding protein Ku